MAWIVIGADGRRWVGADWIVRNAFDVVIPTLRLGASTVADAYERAQRDRERVLDLGPVLEDERHAAAWRFAVRQAVRSARSEGDESWYLPHARAAFEGALEALETLVRPDGNELLADLASTFGIDDQKIFGDPPLIRR